MRDLNCTEFQATIGFSVFVLGMGIVPLVTTSFSEEFGRRPIYIASAVGLVLTSMMIALYVCSQNLSPHGFSTINKIKEYPDCHSGAIFAGYFRVDGHDDGWRNYG